jgi:hypothetical protein
VPTMVFAVAVSVVLFGIFWLLQRRGRMTSPGMSRNTPSGGPPTGFHTFYKPFFAMLTPPWVRAFWDGVSAITLSLADRVRMLYTGNGQTYCLYILYYFIVLYVVCGGFDSVWKSR